MVNSHLANSERWGQWSVQASSRVEKPISDSNITASTTSGASWCHAHDQAAIWHSRVEVEQLRIRVGMESVRSEVKLTPSPPTGRVFDSRPDLADESAYDALEKAYNLAFSVSTPERLRRSDNEHTMARGDGLGHPVKILSRKFRAYEQGGAEPLGGTLYTTKSLQCLRSSTSLQANSLLESCRDFASHPLRSDSPRSWQEVFVNINSSILERAESVALTRVKRHKLLLQLAEACRSKVMARSKARHQSDNGYTRATTTPLKAQIPPTCGSNQQRLSIAHVENAMTTLARENNANDPLCEFLAREIVSFAEYVLEDRHRTYQDRCATLASRQLWRDHQRALSDYEVDTIRSYNPRSTYFIESSVNCADCRVENPFQHSFESVDTPWKSSLKRLEFSDWHTGARREPCTPAHRDSILNCELERLYERGLNGIILHQGDGARTEVASFLLQLQRLRSVGYNHLVITDPSLFQDWTLVLSAHGIHVEPWTTSEHYGDQLAFTHQGGKGISRVLLCQVDDVVGNVATFATTAHQVCVFDISHHLNSEVQSRSDLWRALLTIGCRQRLLLLTPSVVLDLRHLALFSYPAAVSSRRRLMAWNCVSFNKPLVSAVAGALALCTVSTIDDILVQSNWIAELENNTLTSAHGEQRILDYIETVLRPLSLDPDATDPAQTLYQPKVELPVSTTIARTSSPRTTPGAKMVSVSGVISLAKNGSQKRRFKAPRSRKRISRCGECLGCLADDCMKCGHCQDMKKYGGPGLRKQSCKRRKCLHPKTWGLTRKKRRSKFIQLEDGDGEVEEINGLDDSDVDFDIYNDEESTSPSEVSEDESDSAKASRSSGFSDSESNESNHSGDDNLYLSQSEMTDDTDEVDTFSDTGSVFRTIRSRVMRCGKCRGCTSGDCMKCIHCQDMKKYGGPGLRKQSCKNRKCVAPKVVVLNQARDRTDDEVFMSLDDTTSGHGDEQRASGSSQDITEIFHDCSRLDVLDVVQECSLDLRRYQFFNCEICSRNFVSQNLLDRHIMCCHEEPENSRIVWEKVFEDCILHPAYELGCLLASRRSINPSWQPPSVRAYAKLEGVDFEYFFLKPYAIVGRMSKTWNKFYNSRGMFNTRGLPGGEIDCHLGDDETIASHHALIAWDHEIGCYTVECLNFGSPLTVNGRHVHFASKPLALESHDLIQIGACTVYFLLPVLENLGLPTASSIPRGEMHAWVDTAVMKQRSQASMSEAINQVIRSRATSL